MVQTLQLNLYVKPDASSDELVGYHGNAIKVRLQAPPTKGQANKALKAFLAKKFSVKPKSVVIISGEHSNNKTVHIDRPSKTLETVLAE